MEKRVNWLDEQLDERRKNDQKLFEKSFYDLSSIIMDHKDGDASGSDATAFLQVLGDVFNCFSIHVEEIPGDITDINKQLDYMVNRTGVAKRRVVLTEGWWKDSVGPLLGAKKDGTIVALLPHARGYRFREGDSGKYTVVNKKTAATLENEAFCFYKPFPAKALTIVDLLLFIAKSLRSIDYVYVAAAALIITLVGMVTPYATNLLFTDVIPLGRAANLLPLAGLFLGSAIAESIFYIIDILLGANLENKMDMAVKSASMSRLLSLPATFFKEYQAGELSSRLESVAELCRKLRSAVLNSGLTSLFSLIYATQIYAFAPTLVAPALLIVFAELAFSILSFYMQIRHQRKLMQTGAKLRGMVFSLISGVQKIKLSGSEKRMFSRWAERYRENAALKYKPPLIIQIAPTMSILFSFGGLLLLYFFAANTGVTTSSYMAFTAAYGMMSAAIMKFASITNVVAEIKPLLEMVEPIMKTPPEVSENKRPVTRLTGEIELSHVSFRYSADGPVIIDDLNLKIKPNQYIAIVGKTGCGKSTLMRLLLGFEKPIKGAIYFNGRDLNTLDVKSVRRNIGVVLQNSRLFAGDIYSNIIVSAPWLSVDQAMEAAEMAGIADDIRKMPMGMHTLISEGSGGISGGQKQRLMIARAIAGKPRVLMFDEATSALDNITQKTVSDSLSKLRCTRIVIAHRLSTIKQCDRILYLDKGKIIEDGTYDDLVKQSGAFAELVRRQMI